MNLNGMVMDPQQQALLMLLAQAEQMRQRQAMKMKGREARVPDVLGKTKSPSESALGVTAMGLLESPQAGFEGGMDSFKGRNRPAAQFGRRNK